jgi:hypothetical protein
MRFTIPQFIDYEAKVIGPLTFKQFIVMAVAGVICFAALLTGSPLIYIPVFIVVGGGAFGLIFLKPQGRTPLTFLNNFLFFTVSSKKYVWKRKIIPTQVVKTKEAEEEKEEEKTPLKIVKKSRLKELSKKIETSKNK